MSSSNRASDSSPSAELANLSLDHASQEIPSSGGTAAEGAANGNGNGQEACATVLTLRALVSTKEAGVIIGKGGANVAELRERSGVKAGVSKVIQGVHDRVLTVTGSLEGVAKVRKVVIFGLGECANP